MRDEAFEGETLQVRRTAHEGQILEGTKTDHGEPDAGRIVPVPATLAWMLEAQIKPQRSRLPAPLLDASPSPLARAHLLPPYQISAPMSAATVTSRTSGRLASTTLTWPRSPAIGSRRCWRGTRIR